MLPIRTSENSYSTHSGEYYPQEVDIGLSLRKLERRAPSLCELRGLHATV
jgi:hypothetical protein